MATNNFGFIPKKYRQPDYEREVFCSANAFYKAENGKLFIVVAQPHFGCGEKWGARIDHFEICRQDEKCRHLIRGDVKTMKETMAILERLLEKNQLPKEKTVEVMDMDKIQGMMVEPFVDEDRAKKVRQALVKAYASNDREGLANAVQEAQKYVDEGGDFPFSHWRYDDSIENYSGSDPDKLAEKYLVRLLHDRFQDDDEDQQYIATGLTLEMSRYFHFADLKKKHPDVVLMFLGKGRWGEDRYFAYGRRDTEAVEHVMKGNRHYSGTYNINVPFLNEWLWGCDFPADMVDDCKSRLLEDGYRVGIYDKEGLPVIRKQPVQLELFAF